jgi:hypothetical protein
MGQTIGKTDLGAPNWVYNNNDMAYHTSSPNDSVEADIESFDGSVRTALPDAHLFEAEHQNPN